MGFFCDETVRWLRGDAQQGQPGNKFIPASELSRHFGENDMAQLKRILEELFGNSSTPSASAILRNERCFMRVFATLLLIGHGQLITDFLRHSALCDERGSFGESSPPQNFPKSREGDDIFLDFQDKHWLFFPHEFRRDDYTVINDLVPLPYLEHKKIVDATNGAIYQAKIHRYYDVVPDDTVSDALILSISCQQA
jgi:hypothetical protein